MSAQYIQMAANFRGDRYRPKPIRYVILQPNYIATILQADGVPRKACNGATLVLQSARLDQSHIPRSDNRGYVAYVYNSIILCRDT